mmetsp:Transcript_55770/g.136949  ORF Transcript_55770/g.136949 Transcript_55770/m.136949 type:complete len:255 (-) Transcript_55770:97-861(-)
MSDKVEVQKETKADGTVVTKTITTTTHPDGSVETKTEIHTQPPPGSGGGGGAGGPTDTCAGCNSAITSGKITRALGNSYHADCFKCAVCKATLEKQFYENDGRVVCKQHSSFQFTSSNRDDVIKASSGADAVATGKTCNHCNKEIRGGVVMCLGNNYCADCVRCHACNARLDTIYKDGNKLACKEHAAVRTEQREVSGPDDDGGVTKIPGEQLVDTKTSSVTNADGSVVETIEKTYRDAAGNERTEKRIRTTHA